MKALVVYESMFGNTERVAQAIADGLREWGEVDLVNVSAAPTNHGSDVDLVVAGGPTHAFSMTRANTRADALRQGAGRGTTDRFGLREWLASLPFGASGDRRQPFATFDTRVAKVRRLPGSAAKSAAKVAREHGYQLIARPASFYVHDVSGPLLEGEIDRARAWARQLGAAATPHPVRH